jgi:Rod binding domain-containing protein
MATSLSMMSGSADMAMQQAASAAVTGRAAAAASAGDQNISPATDARVDKAAKDFEGMFLAQMLQPMFETVKTDSMFGGGHGEEMMRGFLTQEYGKIMAKDDRFGIAAYIKSAMLHAQGKNRVASSANAAGGKHSLVPPVTSTTAKAPTLNGVM